MMEQRLKQRFALHLPYEIHRSDGQPPLTGYTGNVSSSGVLFFSSTGLSVGEKVEYTLLLPRGSRRDPVVRVLCAGMVIRSEPKKGEFAATMERYEFLREAAASVAA